MSESKINTLMNVMLEITNNHFARDGNPFEMSQVHGSSGNYSDTDLVFLKSFMDKLCCHLGDQNCGFNFIFRTETMDIEMIDMYAEGKGR